MSDILYRYENRVYLNITNKCCCNCTFCIRNHQDNYGESGNLWLETEPSIDEIINEIKAFDFKECEEVVFCGFGEPTFALEKMIAVSKYLRTNFSYPIRLNTNGLSDLINNRPTARDICNAVDVVSISLNMPDSKSYNEVVRPIYGEEAFDAMLRFATNCKQYTENVRFTVVNVIGEDAIEKCKMLASLYEIPLKIRSFT